MRIDEAQVLVVDDVAMIRRAVRQALLALGCRAVDEAADGEAGLEAFRRHPYDVVITDWQMPRRTGLELLRSIRGEAGGASTPVVMISGEATPERAEEARREGATCLLAKPFSPRELMARLKQVLEGGR